jgi:16S rRNA (uracil1498-N3)-methyltransferase
MNFHPDGAPRPDRREPVPDADPSDSFAGPRLHVDAGLAPGAQIDLPDRAARHVAALRLRAGDRVVLFAGDGYEWRATLTAVGRRGVQAAVHERHAVSRESPLDITLVQGVCAADRMDLVLQKATELGVARIRPVVTTRSIVRLSQERQERREAHWQNVVVAACEQCGRNVVPLVHPITGLRDYLGEGTGPGTRIVLSPLAAQGLRAAEVHAPVTILVGPEGGLAEEERELAALAGFAPVRMGPRILRTETAPLAAIAALQVLHGDW